MKATLKPHEIPAIPGCIRMLAQTVVEEMSETHPDWERVIWNLEEAYEQALVAYQHAQESGDLT